MRRFALAGVVLALLAAAFAGAGCGRAKPHAKPGVEVVFWQPWAPGVVAPAVARFEAANPGTHVRVVQVTFDALGDSLEAARAANTWPDLCALPASQMPRWLDAGVFSDWSAGVAGLRDSLAGWPACTVGDALYGLPWLLRSRVLAGDPVLLRRAHLGATLPATWPQLRTAALRLRALGGGVYGFGFPRGDSLETAAQFLSFAWSRGADVLSAAGDSSRIGSREALAALEFLASLRRATLLASRDTLTRAAAAGRLGLWIADPGALPKGAVVAPLPVPAADSARGAAWSEAVVLAGFAGARRKEAALRLALALARSEEQFALARAVSPWSPSLAGADTAAAFAHAPLARTLARACAGARFAPRVANWDSMRIAIGGAVDDALAGRATPREALAAADARVGALAARR